MGIFSGLSGGNAARSLREQAHQLNVKAQKESRLYGLQQAAINDQRLDLFEKDRLAEQAQQQAMDQLNTPGALILLGDTEGADPELQRQRRAAFFTQSTTGEVV